MAAAKGLLEFLRSPVAEFKDGKLTWWTVSQATHLLCKRLAAMPEAAVRCVYVDGSGCYGRNGTKTPLRTPRSWRAPRTGPSACNGCARTSKGHRH